MSFNSKHIRKQKTMQLWQKGTINGAIFWENNENKLQF